MFRDQRRETEAEYHSLGARDSDALVQVIDAWSQDEVIAGIQGIIDRRCGVHRLGNEEPLEWDGRAGRRAAGPCSTRGGVLHRRHEDVVAPSSVYVPIWRLSRHPTGRERGVPTTA